MRAFRALSVLLGAMIPVITSAAFDPQAMREKYVVGSSHHTIGYGGVSVRDVDGLPGDEILIGYRSMWHLLRWDTKTGSFAQLGFYETGVGGIFGGGGLVNVRFADFGDGEPLSVVLLGETGRIGRFDLDGTLRTIWTPKLGPNDTTPNFMRVADLDGTPGDEILLRSCSEITVWDFGASAPLARIKIDDCQSVYVAQLDADSQLEIVLGTGSVIDSRTMQTQWRYQIGFGYALTSGDIDGDGIAELIGCASRRCTAYDVVQQTALWESYIDYPGEWGPVTTADVDSDGRVEIFGGSIQHGSIFRVDGATGLVAAQFDKSGGTNFVVVANLDGDCDHEVIWARDGDSTGIDTLHVSDPAALDPIWSGVQEDRGSSGIAFADFAGNGNPQVLWTSNGASIQRFVGFNPSTRFRRQSSRSYTAYAEHFPLVAAAQLDADPAVEYVLPVNANDYRPATITVFDGATREEQWSLRIEQDGDDVSALTAGDVSGDGVADIIVGLSINYFPADHEQSVAVIDGATRKQLWRAPAESRSLDSFCSSCIAQLVIADLEFDGNKEILAIAKWEGLYCFDARTGALRWHKPDLIGANAVAVADIDPSPGAEIVLPRYDDGKLVVLDATATTVLREKNVLTSGRVFSVQPVDLDGDGVRELVTAGDAGLEVLSSTTLDVLWSGGWVLPWLSVGNQFVVADVDGDSTTEIVVPSAHSLRVFEYRPLAQDNTPPAFRSAAMDATSETADCCALTVQWSPASDAASMPVRYRVYRSTKPDFTPGRASFVAETAAEAYMDRTLSGGATYFYAVTAVDSKGNESNVALRTSALAPESCMVRRRIMR